MGSNVVESLKSRNVTKLFNVTLILRNIENRKSRGRESHARLTRRIHMPKPWIRTLYS